MSYQGDRGEVSAVPWPATEVPELAFHTGTTARFVATGSLTARRLSRQEWTELYARHDQVMV
jgi:hypothetical protein